MYLETVSMGNWAKETISPGKLIFTLKPLHCINARCFGERCFHCNLLPSVVVENQ